MDKIKYYKNRLSKLNFRQAVYYRVRCKARKYILEVWNVPLRIWSRSSFNSGNAFSSLKDIEKLGFKKMSRKEFLLISI